jgi:hypothetical protein
LVGVFLLSVSIFFWVLWKLVCRWIARNCSSMLNFSKSPIRN